MVRRSQGSRRGREWSLAELGLVRTGELISGVFGAFGGRVWGRNPRWGWEFVGAVPKVGLRASGQPWARGRNPFGIGWRIGRMDGMDGMGC
jgi:hypothetical protein